jgi:hypothetical protein
MTQIYKKGLFDLYSKSLNINSNIEMELFLCPICHRLFSWEGNDLLTIEHVVPKKLGGTMKTLTCKKCNNEYGSELISKLKFNLDMEDKVKNKKPFDAKMTIDGKSVVVDYIIGEKHELITQVHRSNPASIEHITSRFSSTNLPPKISLKFNVGYKKETEQLAVLLICYLALFRHFGYFYALSPWGLQTRDVIVNRETSSDLLKMSASPNAIINDGRPGIVICREPNEFKNFVGVYLRFRLNGYTKYEMKLLPFYPETKFDPEIHLKAKDIQISGSIVPYSRTFLQNPNYVIEPKPHITF